MILAVTSFSLLRRFLPLLLACSAVARLSAATLTWDLPSQPLSDALMSLSAKSGYQVLFSSSEMAGVKSRAVQGDYEPLDALRMLLTDTHFEAVPTGAKRVVVRAQPRSLLSGIVLSARDGKPVAGAMVRIEGTSLSTITGKNGRFRLARVPSGTYTIIVSAEGLQSTRIEGLVVDIGREVELKPITLSGEMGLTQGVGGDSVAESSLLLSLEKIVVTPSRFGVSEGTSASNSTLTHEDLETLPQLGEDLYRAIGRLPGLATTDLSAKFWVRGAPDNQVLVRLDGFTLLEPYHIKDFDGGLAIIDIETVSRLDLISGGFTSEFGDRLAGVLQMETASYTGSRSRTTLGLSLTGIRATNRGTFSDGKGNWMVSGRMGYPDIAIKMVGGNGKTVIRYHDIFGKIEYQPAPGHTIGLDVLEAGDAFSIKETNGRNLSSSYGNNHLWGRWRAELSSGLSGETILGYSSLRWHRSGAGLLSGDRPFELSDQRDLKLQTERSDWSLPVGERLLFRSGFELQSGSAKYRYHRMTTDRFVTNGVLMSAPRILDLNPAPQGMNDGAYISARFRPYERLTLEPGLRYDWSDYGPTNGGGSPRLNAAFDLGKHSTLRAAWGTYRQQQGLHEVDVMDGESIIHRAERAEQRVVGLETRLGSTVALRVEAYQRITSNPRPHGENLIEKNDVLGELQYDRVVIRPSRAEARGVEFTIESRRNGPFDWSATYALARTTETLRGVEVPRERDQRHTFQTDFSYRPNPRWQFTTSWQYHTGWPLTAKYYSNIPLSSGGDAVGYYFGPINGDRLPAYHRLDLRATRIFQLQNGTLRVFVDVFNAYDHKNVANYNTYYQGTGSRLTTSQSAEKLLPILPSAGVIWDF